MTDYIERAKAISSLYSVIEFDFFKNNVQSIIDNIENKRITTVGEVLSRLREVANSKVVFDGDDYLISACDTVYTSSKSAYKVLAVDRVSGLIYLDDKQWHNPTNFYKNITHKTKDGVEVSVGDTIYDEDIECVLEEYVGDGRFMVEGDCDPIAVKCVYANPRCVSADGCVIYECDYVYDHDGNQQSVMQTDVSDRSQELWMVHGRYGLYEAPFPRRKEPSQGVRTTGRQPRRQHHLRDVRRRKAGVWRQQWLT